MTAAIDERTLYTDYFESQGSSVIDQAWYDSKSQRLFIGLLNGVIVGYEGVSPEVFSAFAKQESLGASAGRYWNQMIKPVFTGISTDGLDETVFYMRDDEDFVPVSEDQTSIQDLLDGLNTVVNVEGPVTFQPGGLVRRDPGYAVPSNGSDNLYTILFDTEDTEENELTIRAASDEAALGKLEKIREIAGWGQVTPLTITRSL